MVTRCIVVHLNRSGSMLEKVSSNTAYSLGLDFIFFTFFFAFPFFKALVFLSFANAWLIIPSFFFLSSSFFAFSLSILFTIIKFSLVVIQNPLKTFFLMDCFLSNIGNCIKSSKLMFLPVLKKIIYNYLQLLSLFTNSLTNIKNYFLETVRLTANPLLSISLTTEHLKLFDAWSPFGISTVSTVSLGCFPFFCGRNTGCTGMPFARSSLLDHLGISRDSIWNTCSRFTSVSLVLKMARKWLCPDGSNGTPAKKKKSQPGGASAKKTPKQTRAKSNEPSNTVPLVEIQFFWLTSLSFFSLLLMKNFLCKTALCLSDVGFYGCFFPVPSVSPPSSSAWYL